ncbi:MAG: hypothetical protein Q9162_007243 [Coniocarpon cinnabarinum]
MKRKLNVDDVPTEAREDHPSPKPTSFADFQLDPRLQQAVASENFSKPTSIQAKAIAPALKGKDVLARAKTGTGKTAAYALPLLQSILTYKTTSTTAKTSALILVPTRELAAQVHKVLKLFTSFCSRDVQCVNLAPQISEQAQNAQLAAEPDVVVATPARARQHAEKKSLSVKELQWIVVDEADLVMSYGYEADFRALIGLLPTQGVQAFLASATLTTEVDELKALFCHDPVVIDLQEEEQKEQATVMQYAIKCAEDEKFQLLIVMFKLNLFRGKSIIFVGDVDRCFKVKMVLQQFGVRSCILNAELPVNSRTHVVEEFNRGAYDIIIATDESDAGGVDDAVQAKRPRDASVSQPDANGANESASKESKRSMKKHKKATRDANYGIARGIDFQHVTCVLNFDLPTTAKSYTHRIGRTGRLGHAGIAMSFVVPRSEYHKHRLLTFPTTQHDEAVMVAIRAAQEKRGNKVEDYAFRMEDIKGWNYRVASALKNVTPGAVREARLKELREELLKSEKLKRHLEENPEDLKWLRHDQETKSARVQPHLKNLPDYLIPGGGSTTNDLSDVGFVGPGRQSENRIRRAHKFNKMRKNPRKRADPLKTFKGRK